MTVKIWRVYFGVYNHSFNVIADGVKEAIDKAVVRGQKCKFQDKEEHIELVELIGVEDD